MTQPSVDETVFVETFVPDEDAIDRAIAILLGEGFAEERPDGRAA